MTTVVIVDDHAMFRAGVRAELGTDVDVVAEAQDVDTAVAAIAAHHPDVVLLDVHLPGGGGVEVMRRTGPTDTKFLALSVSDAAEDVIGTIRGGARGYVTKTITGPELVHAVDRIATGNDRDNRAAVRAVGRDELDLVGIAVHGPRNGVDKAFKGAKLHP